MTDFTQNFGYWIKQYSKLANQAMEDILRPYQIGRTQWYILHHLYYKKTLSQKELQAQLQVESATLTKVLAPLISRGYVTQTQNKKDKRNKDLALTVDGKEKWKELPNPLDLLKTKALKGVSAEEIEKARLVLEAAVRNLEGNEG